MPRSYTAYFISCSLRKCYRHNPSPNNQLKLSSAESHPQCDIANESNYEMKLVSSSAFSYNAKIFRYIRNLSGQNKFPAIMSWGSNKATTAIDKANLFNRFFYSVFNSHSDTLSSRSFPNSSLCSVNISLLDTFNALSSLDCSKQWVGMVFPLSF